CFFRKPRARGFPLIDHRVVREKFAAILEDSEFVWHGCGHGAVGGVFCDETNQGLSKSSCASLPASHQYGLQIAEGMVTFFESYERELEKYWRKTLFFQFSSGIPPLPDSSDAHKGRRHQSAR